MTVINTNVGALTARTYAVKATATPKLQWKGCHLALRINSAADDAAGLAVANKMESQLRGMNMAIRNSQDGISLCRLPKQPWVKSTTWPLECVNSLFR